MTCLTASVYTPIRCMDPYISKAIGIVTTLSNTLFKYSMRDLEKHLDEDHDIIAAMVIVAKHNCHITTPIHKAAMIYSSDNVLLRILRRVPEESKAAVVNLADATGRSPLHIAAMCGYSDNVETLLKNKADIKQEDAIGNTAMHWAAMASTSAETIATLAAAERSLIDQPNKAKRSPLYLATFHGRIKTVKALIEQGADIKTVDEDLIKKIKTQKKPEDYWYNTYPDIVQILKGQTK